MGKNRIIRRILDIDTRLIGNVTAARRVELEKKRYDLVEKMIKLKKKEYEQKTR